jgi:hypothetical protein
MPLHFCRAHWKRAPSGGRARPGHEGLWHFVEGYWKGHPKNGTIMHDYAPMVRKQEITVTSQTISGA